MKVLVIVDMQIDFICGELGTSAARKIVPKVVSRMKKGINNQEIIICTKDTHDLNYYKTLEGSQVPVHCQIHDEGWDFICPIRSIYKDHIFYKSTYGSSTLYDYLLNHKDDIDEIEFCGVCTDICVISNVLMARMALPNTRIIVNANLCAGTTPEKHNAALKVMESCGIEIVKE